MTETPAGRPWAAPVELLGAGPLRWGPMIEPRFGRMVAGGWRRRSGTTCPATPVEPLDSVPMRMVA